MKAFAYVAIASCCLALAAAGPSHGGDPVAETQRFMEARNLTGAMKRGAYFLAYATHDRPEKARTYLTPSEQASAALADGKAGQLLARYGTKLPFEAALAGVDMLTPNAVSMVYILITADGPVALKLYIYHHDGQPHLWQIDTAHDWRSTEKMLESVRRLPASMRISIRPKSEDDQQDAPEQAK